MQSSRAVHREKKARRRERQQHINEARKRRREEEAPRARDAETHSPAAAAPGAARAPGAAAAARAPRDDVCTPAPRPSGGAERGDGAGSASSHEGCCQELRCAAACRTPGGPFSAAALRAPADTDAAAGRDDAGDVAFETPAAGERVLRPRVTPATGAAAPRDALDDSSLRRIAREALAYIDQKCSSRTGDARPDVLADVSRRVAAALGSPGDSFSEAVLRNIRQFLTEFGPHSREEASYTAAFTVLAAMMDEDMNVSAAADALGVERRAVARAVSIRTKLERRGVLDLPERRSGGARNFLEPAARWGAHAWWLASTRESPIQLDAKREFSWLNNRGELVVHQGVQLQDRSDRRMFELFRFEKPDIEIGFASFKGICKPPWVRHYQGRFVCLSVKDEQQRLLVDAAKLLVMKLRDDDVACRCARGARGCVRNIGEALKHEGQLRNAVLCDKGDSLFHNLKCVRGQCASCGWAKRLGSTCTAFDNTPDARWREYTKVEVQAEGNAPKKTKLVEIVKAGTRLQLFDRLREHTAKWIPHDFVGRWQMAAIKGHVRDQGVHAQLDACHSHRGGRGCL
jgi:hypothetical protein